MIRTKGEAGTGNIVEAVRHMRAVMKGIRELAGMREDGSVAAAKEPARPRLDVVRRRPRREPAGLNFRCSMATPVIASLMRHQAHRRSSWAAESLELRTRR